MVAILQTPDVTKRRLPFDSSYLTLSGQDNPLDHLQQYSTLLFQRAIYIAFANFSQDLQCCVKIFDAVALFGFNALEQHGELFALLLTLPGELLINSGSHPVVGESPPQVQFLFIKFAAARFQRTSLATNVLCVLGHIGQIHLADFWQQFWADLDRVEMVNDLWIDFVTQVIGGAAGHAIIRNTTAFTIEIRHSTGQFPQTVIGFEIDQPLQ